MSRLSSPNSHAHDLPPTHEAPSPLDSPSRYNTPSVHDAECVQDAPSLLAPPSSHAPPLTPETPVAQATRRAARQKRSTRKAPKQGTRIASPGDKEKARKARRSPDPPTELSPLARDIAVGFAARWKLTRKSTEILELAISGVPRENIAQMSGISEDGLKWRTRSLLRRCGAATMQEAVRMALLEYVVLDRSADNGCKA